MTGEQSNDHTYGLVWALLIMLSDGEYTFNDGDQGYTFNAIRAIMAAERDAESA